MLSSGCLVVAYLGAEARPMEEEPLPTGVAHQGRRAGGACLGRSLAVEACLRAACARVCMRVTGQADSLDQADKGRERRGAEGQECPRA